MTFTATVELEGVNGRMFTLSGPGMGLQGAHLNTNIEGLGDAPVKTIHNSHAFQTGSTYGGKRNLQRDVVFGVWITDDYVDSWAEADSEWRKAWSYDEDCTLLITSEGSRRSLKLRLSEQPQLDMERDPRLLGRGLVVMTCVANDPWWYEDEVTSAWVSTTSTLGGSVNYGTVTVSNPTDVPIWPKYVVHGPGEPLLPDYSFGDDRHERATIDAARTIWCPPIATGDTILFDSDEEAEQATSLLDLPYWMTMAGKTFCYPIPPYTPPTQLQVGFTRAPANAGIQVRCPRPWSRPWGLQ